MKRKEQEVKTIEQKCFLNVQVHRFTFGFCFILFDWFSLQPCFHILCIFVRKKFVVIRINVKCFKGGRDMVHLTSECSAGACVDELPTKLGGLVLWLL